MTKKHFVAFAKAVKFSDASDDVKVAMAKMVANVAASFNGRFDRDKFFKAAGVSN